MQLLEQKYTDPMYVSHLLCQHIPESLHFSVDCQQLCQIAQRIQRNATNTKAVVKLRNQHYTNLNRAAQQIEQKRLVFRNILVTSCQRSGFPPSQFGRSRELRRSRARDRHTRRQLITPDCQDCYSEGQP